jgi:hypothetical protein
MPSLVGGRQVAQMFTPPGRESACDDPLAQILPRAAGRQPGHDADHNQVTANARTRRRLATPLVATTDRARRSTEPAPDDPPRPPQAAPPRRGQLTALVASRSRTSAISLPRGHAPARPALSQQALEHRQRARLDPPCGRVTPASLGTITACHLGCSPRHLALDRVRRRTSQPPRGEIPRKSEPNR